MMNVRSCEICDNPTEHEYCVECGEQVCVICHEAYGCPELSQSVSVVALILITSKEQEIKNEVLEL